MKDDKGGFAGCLHNGRDYRRDWGVGKFFVTVGAGDRHGPRRGWWGQSPHGLAFAVAVFCPKGTMFDKIQEVFPISSSY